MRYPNPWDSAAQGVSQGIQDYANIAGLQMKKEEARQRTTLFNEAASDIAYKNQPVGTVGELINSTPDLDDTGKKKVRDTVGRYGYKEGDIISRKHLPEIQKLVEENPNIVETVNTERLRNLRAQSAGITDPVIKADLDAKIERYKLGTKHLIDVSEAKSKEKTAEAHMITAKTAEKVKEAFKTAEQMIVNDPTLTSDQKLAKVKELKKHEASLDPVSRMMLADKLRAQAEERRDQLQTTRETAKALEDKKVKHEDKEAAAIEKAGGLDKVNPDTVKSWNRTRENLGMSMYNIQETPGTLWGTNIEVKEPGAGGVQTKTSGTAPAAVSEDRSGIVSDTPVTQPTPVKTQPGPTAKPSYTEYYNALKEKNPNATDAAIKAHLKKKGIKK